MDAIGWLSLAATVWKVVDWVKFLRAKDWNAVLTQAVVWIGGILLVWLAGASTLAGSFIVPGTDMTLAQLNGAAIALVGLQLGSVASATVDFKKARDTGDTAKTPPLLPE